MSTNPPKQEEEKQTRLHRDLNHSDDHLYVGSIPIPSTPLSKRRRYDNDFKAKVLEHLKIPGVKLPAVARKFKLPENTVRDWTKVSVVRVIETARAKNSGQLKANMFDPLHRLSKSLTIFFEHNERQPQNLRQPVTTKLIVTKGKETKEQILELHRIQPFLQVKEKRALESFTASDSWAKKFAKRHHLKMSGARIKELTEEETRQFQSSLNQIAARIKQAGPGYDDIANLIRQAGEKLVHVQSTNLSQIRTHTHRTKMQQPNQDEMLLSTALAVSHHPSSRTSIPPHIPTDHHPEAIFDPSEHHLDEKSSYSNVNWGRCS